jgi:hypothetical protein
MFLNTQVDATLDIELDNDELGAELEKYFYKKTSKYSVNESREFRISIKQSEEKLEKPVSGEKLEFYKDHNFIKNIYDGFPVINIDESLILTLKNGHLDIKYTELCNFNIKIIKHAIRAYIDQIMFNQGYVLLHMASVKIGERVIGVIGDKGAGKTTTIVKALDTHNAGYISNDRVYTGLRGDSLHLVEREAETKVGLKTIENSSLAKYLKDAQKDEVTEKFFFNRIYKFFEGVDRVTSAYLTDIVIPNISSPLENFTEICFDTNLLIHSIINECQGFNLYKALFAGQINTRLQVDNVLGIKVYRVNGEKGILSFLNQMSHA